MAKRLPTNREIGLMSSGRAPNSIMDEVDRSSDDDIEWDASSIVDRMYGQMTGVMGEVPNQAQWLQDQIESNDEERSDWQWLEKSPFQLEAEDRGMIESDEEQEEKTDKNNRYIQEINDILDRDAGDSIINEDEIDAGTDGEFDITRVEKQKARKLPGFALSAVDRGDGGSKKGTKANFREAPTYGKTPFRRIKDPEPTKDIIWEEELEVL